MSIQSINPATGEVIEEFEPFSPQQIDEALNTASTAYQSWRKTSFAERSALFRQLATYLRAHKTELGRIASLEMGKPIRGSEAEAEKCAWNCDYYAENAERFLADEKIVTNATESYVSYLPIGIVLALMPEALKRMAAQMLAQPARTLRVGGLVSAVIGLAVVWLVRG